MNQTTFNCICTTGNKSSNAFDLVTCTSCKREAHATCYEIYGQDAKKNFLCFECRMEDNSPFYELEQAIIKPVLFYSSEAISTEYAFNLPPVMSAAILTKKTHSILAVFTKVVYENPKYIELPANNTSISMFCNNRPLSLHSRREVCLDPNLVEGKNTLSIATSKLPSKCILGIYLGKKVDVKDIAKKVLKLEAQSSLEESKRNFESIRFRELEVLAAFPVKDPITNKMMLFAARGSKCRHLQCFDLINYLKFYQNPTDKYWQCFCCKNIIPWKDLRIDQYVYTILKEIREKYSKEEVEDIDHICFDEKGDWKLQQDFSKEWEQNFAGNREKRQKEKKDRMEIEIEEGHKQSGMVEETTTTTSAPKNELSIEEAIDDYNALQKKYAHLLDSELIFETVASNMKELHIFKNFTPVKVYEFFDKTKMLIGCSLPGIFGNSDEKQIFYKLDELAEMVYKKKLSSIIPIIFAWVRNYDELIVLTLHLITKSKRNDPDMALALELLLCYSWFMETRKISFEGVLKQSLYQLFGKMINYFGDKLQWKAQQYATIMIIFKKEIPDLHVPGMIPKKFCEESEKVFNNQADFIVNMVKGSNISDLIQFLDLIYKPPIDEILQEEDKILKYVFYYFTLLFKKHSPNLSNQEVWECFEKWDKYKKAAPVLTFQHITVSNITEKL